MPSALFLNFENKEFNFMARGLNSIPVTGHVLADGHDAATCAQCIGDDAVEAARARLMLVYQNGIANVFRVQAFNMADYGRNAHRLLQSDFRTCEAFARGAAAAGAIVQSASCDMVGDITAALWSDDELGPFISEQAVVKAEKAEIERMQKTLETMKSANDAKVLLNLCCLWKQP